MKKIGILISILFFCSCSIKKDYKFTIKTIIEENTNTLIAINYPITKIKKIDKSTKKYVNNIYNKFLKNYGETNQLNKKYELNIDYEYYNLSNNYISVILYTQITSSNNELITNEIYNYVYDINNKTKINFEQLIETNKKEIKDLIYNLLFENYGNIISINKFQNLNYDNLNFTITNEYVKIIFQGNDICDKYDENLEIKIPNSYFNLLKKFQITNEKNTNYINPSINYIDTSKPVVALTFDDGPSAYTKEIIETLKQYECNATFFVLGNKIANHSDTIIQMYKNGNEIGNHSYNHKWLTKLSIQQQKEQIEKTQEIIEEYTGFTPKYLRPTYGSVNKNLKNNTNLEIILWNIDTKDWKYKNVDTIVNNALKDVKDGSIILMHDTYERTNEAVKIIIPKLIENGYQLVTISELKEIQKLRNKNEIR